MERQSVAWMERFGLFPNEAQRRRLIHAGCGRIASHVLPLAAGRSLRWASDLFLWIIALDDEICDEGPIGRDSALLAETLSVLLRGIEAPDGALHTADRYAESLLDLRFRMADFCDAFPSTTLDRRNSPMVHVRNMEGRQRGDRARAFVEPLFDHAHAQWRGRSWDALI